MNSNKNIFTFFLSIILVLHLPAASNASTITLYTPINTADQFEIQTDYANLLLASQSALIVNDKTGKILFQKNPNRIMPIASISKLMSSIVILDAKQNMNQPLTITKAEIDRLKGTGSRLSIGTRLTRSQMLHLSLMSSENRATTALGRNYPGGMKAFVKAMNRKAKTLGMAKTRFYEPTGLDFRNVSTANDLYKLVQAAYTYPVIRHNSTSSHLSVRTNKGQAAFKNSNILIHEGNWNIKLQKTGYTREAGRSMVLKTNIQNQPVTIILLNAPSSPSRVNDTRKIELWMLQNHS